MCVGADQGTRGPVAFGDLRCPEVLLLHRQQGQIYCDECAYHSLSGRSDRLRRMGHSDSTEVGIQVALCGRLTAGAEGVANLPVTTCPGLPRWAIEFRGSGDSRFTSL